MNELADGAVAHVQGSAKVPYELKNIGGVISCSCPAWRNAGGPIDRRSCKHLRAFLGEEAEWLRVGIGGTKPVSAPKGDGPPVLLAHPWEPHHDLTGWWMSEKLDGVRAWWTGTTFVSRLGNPFLAPAWFTDGLPDHPLDGELWLGRQAFQDTVSVVRRADAGEAWRPMRFLVFDVPSMDAPFEERLAWLHASMSHPFVTLVDHIRCQGTDHLRAELARVEALGGEGLMMRRPGSRYESGRSTSLLKVKTFHDDEARVVDTVPGKGKHKGRVGALVLERPDGVRFQVGTGLSDAARADPPPTGAWVTYRYQELTRAGVPRFPSYVGVAIDKQAPSPPSKPAPSTAPVPPPPAPTEGAWSRFEMAQKFWAIQLHGASHTVHYGKLGTAGQHKTKDFADADAAQRDAEALIRSKTNKGYAAVD